MMAIGLCMIMAASIFGAIADHFGWSAVDDMCRYLFGAAVIMCFASFIKWIWMVMP